MPNSFPGSLNNYVTGASSVTLVTAGHASAHNAIEAKLGIDGSDVTTSIDYLLKNTASINPGHHHSNTSLDSIASSKVTGLPTFPTGTIVGTTDSQTFTNKRITKRVSTTASSATPTPNADTDDEYTITALAAGATFGAPTGTPTEGQTLLIRIKDNATARSLAFNAIYRFSSDLAAPTTTVISKTLYLGFIYNSTDTKWDCVALLNNF